MDYTFGTKFVHGSMIRTGGAKDRSVREDKQSVPQRKFDWTRLRYSKISPPVERDHGAKEAMKDNRYSLLGLFGEGSTPIGQDFRETKNEQLKPSRDVVDKSGLKEDENSTQYRRPLAFDADREEWFYECSVPGCGQISSQFNESEIKIHHEQHRARAKEIYSEIESSRHLVPPRPNEPIFPQNDKLDAVIQHSFPTHTRHRKTSDKYGRERTHKFPRPFLAPDLGDSSSSNEIGIGERYDRSPLCGISIRSYGAPDDETETAPDNYHNGNIKSDAEIPSARKRTNSFIIPSFTPEEPVRNKLPTKQSHQATDIEDAFRMKQDMAAESDSAKLDQDDTQHCLPQDKDETMQDHWEDRRSRIEELYGSGNHRFKEIAIILRREGFFISASQLKSHIKKWGLYGKLQHRPSSRDEPMSDAEDPIYQDPEATGKVKMGMGHFIPDRLSIPTRTGNEIVLDESNNGAEIEKETDSIALLPNSYEQVYPVDMSAGTAAILSNEGQGPSDSCYSQISVAYSLGDFRGSSEEDAYKARTTPSFEDSCSQGSKPTLLVRFNHASQAAYAKLLAAAPSQSAAFQGFVGGLGTHDDLVKRGFRSLETFLKHEVVTSLADVYSFLHVAYAVSQIESDDPARSTPAQFSCGIGTLRNCLSNEKAEDLENEVTERELFDEIVEVMWDEIDFAVAWMCPVLDWNLAHDLSQKAQRLEIAKEMLKRAAEYDAGVDIEPDLDPSLGTVLDEDNDDFEATFKRELRSFKQVTGLEILPHQDSDYCQRINSISDVGIGYQWKRHVARQNPPDKPTWLNFVTGFTFLLVAGFLQTVHKGGEVIQHEPNAPYAFLCHPDPEPPDECSLPQWDDYKANFFADAIKDKIVEPLRDFHLGQVAEIAFNLVHNDVIRTIRHFEDYILALRKLFRTDKSANLVFVAALLFHCWNCSDHLEERFPGTNRIKPTTEPEYSWEYLDGKQYQECFSLTNDEMPAKDEMPVDRMAPQTSNKQMEVSMDRVNTPELVADTADDPSPIESDPPTISPAATQPLNLQCQILGCETKTFFSKANLNRHLREMHPEPGTGTMYRCGIGGCGNRFSRKDNMYKHQRRKHSISMKKKMKRPKGDVA